MGIDYLDARNQIYIPGALIIVGCAITKPVWLPYAALVVGGLVWLKLNEHRRPPSRSSADVLGPRPVLKPDVLQEFELEERTVVSPNTSMYVTIRNRVDDVDIGSNFLDQMIFWVCR